MPLQGPVHWPPRQSSSSFTQENELHGLLFFAFFFAPRSVVEVDEMRSLAGESRQIEIAQLLAQETTARFVFTSPPLKPAEVSVAEPAHGRVPKCDSLAVVTSGDI